MDGTDPANASDDPAGAGSKLARGLAWVAALRWAGQAMSWVVTIVVARLLDPTDYGIMGMAMVAINLATVLADYGLGSSVVAVRSLDVESMEQLHSVSTLLGVGAALLAAIVAHPLALFFRQPAVAPVVATLGLLLLANAFAAVPMARLQRALDFRSVAIADLLRSMVGGAASLTLAAVGVGVWALVGGTIFSAFAAAVYLQYRSPTRLARPDLPRLRGVLAYSAETMLGRLGWMFYSSMPAIIGGRLLGATALGAYTFAWTLASLPGDKVVNVVNSVAQPVMADASHDRGAVAQLLSRMLEGIAFITWPLLIGGALLGHQLIAVVFGPQWREAAGPFVILCLYNLALAVMAPFSNVFLVTNSARRNRQLSVAGAIILPLAFLVGAKLLGADGLAVAWWLAVPLFGVPSMLWLRELIGFSWGDLGKALVTPFVSTLAMGLAVLLTLKVAHLAAGPSLILSIIAGITAYGAVIWRLRGAHARLALQYFRKGRRPPQ